MKKLIFIALLLAAALVVLGGYPVRSEETTGAVMAVSEEYTQTPEPTSAPAPVPTPEPTPAPEEPEANDQLDRATAWMEGAEIDPVWSEFGGENFSEIMWRLTAQYGLSTEAACGIAANMWFESAWEPAQNAYDGSGSYGLCQWLGGRCSQMWWWCEGHGYDGATVEGQIAYMMHELENYPGVELTGDAYSAGYTFCIFFEAPNDVYTQARMRAQYAEEIYGVIG